MDTVRRRAIVFVLTAVLGWAMVLPVAVSAATAIPQPAIGVWPAQEEPQGEDQSIPLNDRSKTVLVWSILAIAGTAGFLAVFYMVKKRLGGFPENPSWVAPITVMPSRELPDEGDFGDQAPPEQAHTEH